MINETSDPVGAAVTAPSQNPPADDAIVLKALRQHWSSMDSVAAELASIQGGNSVLWDIVADDQSSPYLAKLATTGRVEFESGLAVAEHVHQHGGLAVAQPVRTAAGALTTVISHNGQLRPLALIERVPGRPVGADEVRIAAAARFLAAIHTASTTYTGPIRRAGNLPAAVDMAFDPLIRPVIEAAYAEIAAQQQLTWGACYNDEPELFDDGDGHYGLVDWGSVTYAPVLWDVFAWADSYSANDQAEFVDAYLHHGPVPATEFELRDAIRRFRWASQLQFSAFRLQHPERFSRYRDHDAAEADRLFTALTGAQLPMQELDLS